MVHTMLALLDLTVDIANAGADITRWQSVRRALEIRLPCLADAGGGPAQEPGPLGLRAALAACLRSPGRTCFAGDLCARDDKARIVTALIAHVDKALQADRVDRRRYDTLVAAMDAISRPLLIVEADLRLVHVNLFAEELLQAAHQLQQQQGRLAFRSKRVRQSVTRHIQDLEALGGRERRCVPLPDSDLWPRSELWMRALSRPEDARGQFLISVLRSDVASRDLSAAALGLTPRQRQLALHLLAGHSLAEAATRMGIARSTAKDHLGALFKLSATARQAELLAWLTRQQMAV